MGDEITTPTGWDQSEDPVLDSPALGLIAFVVAVLSALCALTYFFSVVTYLGAVVAVPLGLLSRGVPASRGLGIAAVGIATLACGVATAVLVTVEG